MAHPLLEALYIGLLASNLGQNGVEPTLAVASAFECTPRCVAAAPRRAERVVYDWAAGNRVVHPTVLEAPEPPMLGISADQARRLVDASAG
jgi:hypothetical protein